MFIDFFYTLRKKNVPVSFTEWMTLMEALADGHINDLDEFYFMARAILVKSEAHFDHYDVAFQEYFKGTETVEEITKQILEWLKNPHTRRALTEEQLATLKKLGLDELIKQLEERLKEQKEAHDGGSYWIGRGGISPFGHSGDNPAGIRIGGPGGRGHAIKIAEERRFRNYRNDLTLDVRQIKLALKGLRRLNRIGPQDELDIDETIDRTAKNVGDIELVWRRRRKNAVKLLLLMDTGGSMDPFVRTCSQLFTAAHSSTHFKDFKYYYFHNCIYDEVYKDMERMEKVSTDYLLQTLEPDYKTVIVGDANMALEELLEKDGAIYYYQRNETPGIEWLKRISKHFTHTVWLNPDYVLSWTPPTVSLISKVFPMYRLTIDGLDKAVKKLVVKR
ncbi:MAG: VWA domain-containing protein [Dehalococcoidales bacterium]|nr:VWA domain-containing protein [Dehalococcoidales bacterium]